MYYINGYFIRKEWDIGSSQTVRENCKNANSISTVYTYILIT